MHYKVYFLDVADRIIRGEDLECDDDTQAIAATRALQHGHAVELWQKGRLVTRIEPSSSQADSPA